MNRVIIFGSINLDLVTKVVKHPNPGETVSGSNFETLAGGKGANQALAASYCSEVKSYMIGAIGKDAFAKSALANLDNSGLNIDFVNKLENISTGVALIAVDQNGENTIIVTPGANHAVFAKQLEEVGIKNQDVLLTQNELHDCETFVAHKLAKQAGAIVIHNAAPARALTTEQLENIDYLITNESELTIVANGFGIKEADPLIAARSLAQLFNTNMIVTLGENGAALVSNESIQHQPATKIKIVDTTGAGDAFCGTFAANIAMDINPTKALENSIKAGGMACTHFGAQRVCQ